MADAVNAGFARSEQLKHEWASLKREMLAIDSSSPDAAHRRHAIHTRMDQVMTDMATVLTETRRLIPPSDIDIDDDHELAPAPAPPQDHTVQYSARKLHIVQRTYDSSSDDSDSEYSQPLAQSIPSDLQHEVDLRSLRQDMMNNANPNDVVTVEGKGLRASIHTFKEKLRKPEAAKQRSSDKDKSNPPLNSPHGKPLSTDDREDLALEQSRLERESRRLKRKPERTSHDDSRLEDIANRLSRISSTLADTIDSPIPEIDYDTAPSKSALSGKKGFFSGKPPRLERSAPVSPDGDNDDELTFDSVDDELAPPSVRGNQKPSSSKRKKGWMALEAGVASFRAFGRNMRQGAVNPRDVRVEPGSNPTGKGNEGTVVSPIAVGDNAFTETAERLQQRGEQLNNVAEDAEAMNQDANDMLAAARALRQRNQKSGFFS